MNEKASWRPTASPETLRQRAGILRIIRDFFDTRDFVEVQTPCLSGDVVVDRYVEPVPVDSTLFPGDGSVWLQTSPEFAMKRLLAAGSHAIYQIGPAFRGGELGGRHNPEFTMLEWYRKGDRYTDGMNLLDEFAREVLDVPRAERMTWREAFQRFADIDPASVQIDADELNMLMAERIEPGLVSIPSVIIFDWPVDQAALARIRDDGAGDPVAERFELYCGGVEIANGYHELVDADEMLERNRRVNRLRKLDGKPELPETGKLLDCMREGLPASCGVALGIDRLVMLALGHDNIASVMPFGWRSA